MFFIIPKEDDKFERAYLVRKKLSVSVTISSLMSFFESMIKSSNKPIKQLLSTNLSLLNIDARLQHAFLNKTRLEKIDFYCQCVQFLERLIRSPNDPTINNQTTFQNPVTIVYCYLKSKLLGRWDRVNLRLNQQTRKLVIVHNKTQIILTLDNYYCRRSKDSSRKGIVLESITDIAETSTLRLGFEQDKFEEVARVIESMVWEATKFKFIQEFKEGVGDVIEVSLNNFGYAKQEETCDTKINGDDIIGWTSYINQEILQEFRQFQQVFLTHENRESKCNGDVVLRGSSKRIFQNEQDVFCLSELFTMSQIEVITALKISSDRWNKFIQEAVLIEKPEYEHLEVVYERCKNKQKTYDYMYLREDKSTLESAEIIIMPVPLKSGIPQLNGCHFEYMYMRVLPISQEESRLIVEIKSSQHESKQLILSYLSQFSNLQAAFDKNRQEYKPKLKWSMRRNTIKVISNEPVLADYEVSRLSSINEPQSESTIICNVHQTMEELPEIQAPSLSLDDFPPFVKPNELDKPEKIAEEDLYLCIQHGTQPREPETLRKIISKHYLFEDWQVAKNGGVVCTNQAMINEQKKIFSHVIKSIGKNIFKSKNILNISLPVTIFKKEQYIQLFRSHLQSIARNLSFAPNLLEKASAADPVQAMKWVVVYLATVGVVGISMQKPFNPLLGETYQGWIDGCPVWLEQISHHPPISAYMMHGRGYKTFGKIEPKIELGMNSVKGLSDHQNIIEFDDGRVLKLTFMKMVIHGLMFGDREFNFEYRNYVYDSTNNLFAEINFGPKKSSYFGKNEHPQDYLYGRVVRVKPSFNQYHKQHAKKGWPEKEHIVEEVSKFEGVWTQQITFDGVKYFDFRTDLPYLVVDEPHPLKSNGSFRRDIQMLRQGKMQESQIQKERIEQVQRRDRRLRQATSRRKH